MVRVKVVNKSGFGLPKYETTGAAGLDVKACLEEKIALAPGEFRLVKTGLFLEIPEGFEVQVRPRSGLAYKHGITVLNSPGTIDADYRGEVGVILINHGKEVFEISSGDRIAQLVLAKVEQIEWQDADHLEETLRGAGGFGSTGKQ
ncbi:MAG: dUTP diphosphatase [Bacteroidetes bacterium]|nr:MAG: dUTP diphosphatase [Bacteroidota bacterium]